MNHDEVYLDSLVGRTVIAGNNRRVGRLEEFHAEQRGDDFHIVAFVIGSAGLMERLNLGTRALFGRSRGGKIARWDQIDISDPTRPRLTCSVQDLKDLET
jgi:sporulation protein YlmC with PRC-barrel domain